MSLKPEKNESNKKKRKERHKFRAEYKLRSTFSFGESLVQINEANDELKEDTPEFIVIGLKIVSSYRALAHALEMFSKAVLERISPYLNLEKLDLLSTDFHDDSNFVKYACSGRTALARASKLFKTKIEKPHLGLLYRIIDARNDCEHREFAIKNISIAINEIIQAQDLFIKIFNDQFRDADLLNEAENLLGIDCIKNFEKIKTEYSKDFKKVLKKLKSMRKTNSVIMCNNCFYETAVVVGDKYSCVWCEENRFKVKCPASECNNLVWCQDVSKAKLCETHSWIESIERVDFSKLLSSDIFREINLTSLSKMKLEVPETNKKIE